MMERMNLILVDSITHKQKLPAGDRRCEHIRKVLVTIEGPLYVGFPDGPMGRARVMLEPDGGVSLDISWLEGPVGSAGDAMKLTVITGYSRPQTCRKLLRDAAPLGIGKLLFFRSDKADPGYAMSSLWSSGEWKEQLLQGVEQSFDTRVPEVCAEATDLAGVLETMTGDLNPLRLALDPYEATCSLGEVRIEKPVVLAIGPERGWSARERDLLRDGGFVFCHMGARILRCETAVVAACSVVASRSGHWQRPHGP
jgi:16S rRNA (uracil1498-N3)-methyltransferase